jgi:hypothetical protein
MRHVFIARQQPRLKAFRWRASIHKKLPVGAAAVAA